MQSIHTIDARDNVMPEIIRDHFKLSEQAFQNVIQDLFSKTISLLNERGISYQGLKSGLVPQADKHEIGFLFNTQDIDSSWYGYDVFQQYFPLLDCRTTQSVLCGDLIGENQEAIYRLLNDSLIMHKSIDFIHSSQYYCVYINNLTDAVLEVLSSELKSYAPYVGYISASFASKAKYFLSFSTINYFLKNESNIIMGHDDDIPESENINMRRYPFVDYGYHVYSIPSAYYDVFLSYKIERPVIPGFTADTEILLAAISDKVLPLEKLKILITDDKFHYLQDKKSGKLKKAGIYDIDREELSQLIKEKISSNYIYNLVFLEEHNVIKFNLLIEIPRNDGGHPTRFTAAIEYIPEELTLRIITLT
jgi:hypothetical protein